MNNFKEFFKKNGFSIAICSSIAIVLIATLYVSYNGFQSSSEENRVAIESNETDYKSVNKSDVKSYKEVSTEITTNSASSSKETSTESSTESLKQSNSSSETTTQSDENKKTENKKEEESSSNEEAKVFSMFDESQEMTWPVSGQIVMDYSTERSVYNKTLDQYKTNDSISISAPEGTDVVASSEGIVQDIFANSEKGNSVVINHGNGWLSTYSQLQKDIQVTVGQVVKEGETIGKIGSPSSYSVLLGPHLDFKITRDSNPKDPKLVLAQIEE